MNCAGPAMRSECGSKPLLDELIRAGDAWPGPLGIGLDATEDGQVRGDDGAARPWLWTLGTARRRSTREQPGAVSLNPWKTACVYTGMKRFSRIVLIGLLAAGVLAGCGNSSGGSGGGGNAPSPAKSPAGGGNSGGGY
ncbi:MAG: hypothetical protein DLM59_08435 [Pseudonocardiales bacterium]|nr:MAG: hypothetical protein DLM59_08435 [Pseudonocardiales bacterium]